MYHFTVNGIPACESPLTAIPDLHTRCSHSSRVSVERDIEECKKIWPDINFEVVDGGCMQPDLYVLEREAGYEEGANMVLNELAKGDPTMADILRSELVKDGKMKDQEEEQRRRVWYDEEYDRQRKMAERRAINAAS